MHCSTCGRKSTKNRTIDPITKVCSECQNKPSEDELQFDEGATMDTIKFSDFKIWMKSELNPIHEEIKALKENMQEIEVQKRQIELLKTRVDDHEETIEALKTIVAKQQRSLRDLIYVRKI